jgi:hypothetical protein
MSIQWQGDVDWLSCCLGGGQWGHSFCEYFEASGKQEKLVQVMLWKLLQFPSFSDGNCPKKGGSYITFFRNFSAEKFF